MVRRGISLKAISEGPVLPAARGHYRQHVYVNKGINEDKGREIERTFLGRPDQGPRCAHSFLWGGDGVQVERHGTTVCRAIVIQHLGCEHRAML